MSTWNDIEDDAPDLAATVRGRFEATGLGMLASLRADGAPRISGIEPWFGDGELWLGMMPGSYKAKDLQRDPRFALHAATADKQMTEGDAKLAGLAVEVTDEATIDRARKGFAEVSGYEPPPGPMHLFRLDIAEVVYLTVATDHMVITTWKPGVGVTTVDRY
jgi:hypothetical protein